MRLKGLSYITVEMLRGNERPSHRPEAVSLREHDMLMVPSDFVKAVDTRINVLSEISQK